jgi:organic radical activating enzyme
MEFNGSNLCNLACLHCNPTYSSKWAIERKKMRPHLSHDHKFQYTPPNVELVEKNLAQLDLSSLRIIHFKGGEPMLNAETLCVLEYLDKISVLQHVDITMFTNATIKNEKIIELLAKAKSLRLTISMDGVGSLNDYIRYGSDVDKENITDIMSVFLTIPNCEISFSVSVMVYNIFNLVDIRDFWLEFNTKYKKIVPFPYFKLAVVSPSYLNPRVLSDSTRKELVEFYKNNQIRTEFENVITLLSGSYLGNDVHNEWVEYTEKIEGLRGNSIIKLVPQLEKELVYR